MSFSREYSKNYFKVRHNSAETNPQEIFDAQPSFQFTDIFSALSCHQDLKEVVTKA